ncbi:chromosome segregation protein SMC [Anaerobranca gottschalkii]|uniref:Chromosome partition protein Smc n=1 Tax=Anaerobranca gottschalkii DSM 13577 TaxID=1120990 RepID=A0A1I0BG48_9FIRM|nr:chromosome segregation protein SMC [Anaerobranca gottschalkii]SET05923.1 condensin subunit Smc [Anaerobranca gottschalkii DSM 13577]
MYLKKIELNGFKSFANKTEFLINPGITAIVGPNGSGKSNIIDAIRWVLGEQSAKALRGSKMEDVIFAGSEGRKQKNYAEVSLVFDNSQGKLAIDYSEVNIIRRIFRDGESEYYINKTPCRLKDIHELFMDTGVGKEAYSIISQGQVEDILNSRPEEKRIIFEEAAGIVKYKNKKKESLKKLEETEQNLVRVDDILYNLEQDLPQIQEEATKAEKYKNIKEKLKGLEVALVLEKINNLEKNYKETDKQIEEKRLLKEEVEKAIQVTNSNKEELIKKIKDIEFQLNSLRDQELQVIKDLEGLKYNLELNKRQLSDGKKRVENLKFENLELEEYLRQVNLKIKELDNKLKINQQELKNNKNLIIEDEEKSEKLRKEIDQLKEGLEKYKEEIIEILNATATIKNELKNLESNKGKLINECGRKERELISFQEKSNQLSDKLHSKQRELEEINVLIDDQNTIKGDLLNKISEIKNNIEVEKDKLDKQKGKVNELKTKITALTNLEMSYAGYNLGPKETLKKFKGHPSLEGSIAQLLTVPEHLTIAIEVALGSSLQNIVVKDEFFAAEVIEYLRKNKLGRATFLPLNIIKGTPLNIEDPDIIGVAANLVQFEKKYSGIMDFLLGRIIIVKNLDIGLKVAKKYNYKYKIVTLEGDVLNVGGAITGGNYNTKSLGLIQRAQEIEALKVELKREEDELVQIQYNLTKGEEEYKKVCEQLEQLQNYLGILQGDKNNKYQEILLIEQEIKTTKEHINLIQQEKKLFENDLKGLEEQISQTLKGEKIKEDEKERITNCIKEINDFIEEKSNLYENLKSKIVSKQITIASLEQEFQSFKKQLTMLNEEKKRTEIKFKDNEKNINSTIEEIGILQKSIEDLSNENLKLEKLKIKINEQQVNHQGLKREVDEKIQQTEEKLKELEQSKEILLAKLNSLNLKKSKILLELDGFTEKLLSEYFLTVGEARALNYPNVDEKEATKEINILREDLKGLGEVNLGAIEEYKKIKGKIDFLKEQKNDLTRAKLDLKKIILEMDRQMATQFEESFEKIKVYFNEVFQKLFNGGRGYLRLTDPENLLESGVEIFVQPPGKKLQSMTLLSGGEKALTAIALLFAILKTKPSPFCVLDEIEASLDEANVDRFGAFLKEMSKEIQFIIVTHRKGTMESADILYGITMEENGISKQISVNLEKRVG